MLLKKQIPALCFPVCGRISVVHEVADRDCSCKRNGFIRKGLLGATLACGLWAVTAIQAQATLMTYTNIADFQANLPEAATTLDFDSQSAGDLIASGDTLGGITFNYDFGGVSIQVQDDFETTSPPNYLGTDDAGVFLDGDDFDLSFAPVNAIGLFFITPDPLIDNDIELSAAGGSVRLAAAEVQLLPQGDQLFFLGLIDDMTTFTTAGISTIGDGFFSYNVDDITTAVAGPVIAITEPPGLALMGIGLTVLLWRSVRRQSGRDARGHVPARA